MRLPKVRISGPFAKRRVEINGLDLTDVVSSVTVAEDARHHQVVTLKIITSDCEVRPQRVEADPA